ncbi:MAG: glycerol-3-phosphate acyltransferase [Candidatus Nealsonbacteria bacterium]
MLIQPIIWVIASYLIGSIPFGYLLSKYSKGVDIRKVGRKQIGATNTFFYAGKWEGVLTGVLDFSKGWVVVFLAGYFGFSVWIQIFSGLAAVSGHNWPIYLKFFGGRGVASIMGVVLALNPQIFFYFAVPMGIITLLWDGAPATIIFLLAYLLFNYHTGQTEYSLFVLMALPVMFLRRLTGIREDFSHTKSRVGPVLSRLFFDRASGPRQFPRWRKIK